MQDEVDTLKHDLDQLEAELEQGGQGRNDKRAERGINNAGGENKSREQLEEVRASSHLLLIRSRRPLEADPLLRRTTTNCATGWTGCKPNSPTRRPRLKNSWATLINATVTTPKKSRKSTRSGEAKWRACRIARLKQEMYEALCTATNWPRGADFLTLCPTDARREGGRHRGTRRQDRSPLERAQREGGRHGCRLGGGRSFDARLAKGACSCLQTAAVITSS